MGDYPTAFGFTGDDGFTYDDAGNRDSASSPGSFTYDVNNRIEESPGRLYAFDADGNLEAITDDATPTPNPIADLAWDFGNRLQSYGDLVAGKTAIYRYDPFGRRILKEVDDGTTTTTTWYVWDGGQLLAEYDASGVRQIRYAYAGGFAPIQVAKKNGGSEDVYDVHSDHLDTPKMLTDDTGAVAWRAAHEAFGAAELDAGNEITFNSRFPGQYYDAESGLHYNRFRYYDPGSGRYVSADPIGQFGALAFDGVALSRMTLLPTAAADAFSAPLLSVGSTRRSLPHSNLYAYALSNPTVIVDPSGLWGVGALGSGSLEGGLGIVGAGVTGSGGAGVFWGADDGVKLGAFASAGAFAGGPGYGPRAPDHPQGSGVNGALGAFVGAGGGAFLTNAPCAGALRGPFDTYSFNLGFGPLKFSAQFGVSGSTWIGSFTVGPGLGVSASSYPTNTWATGQ